MTEKREKTVSYRRAQWLVDNPASINLAMCVKQAAQKLRTNAERTLARSNGQLIRLAAVETDDEDGHYLHLVVDTPGELGSVIPTDRGGATELVVATTAPPPNTDFMDGDAFVYVRGNDVCLCTSATTDAAIRWFLAEFFKVAAIRQDAWKFNLIKVGNLSKVALIHKEGVKEILLKGVISEATSTYSKRRGQPAGILGQIGREINAVLGTPNSVNEDGLNVCLALTADRRRKGLALGEKRLEELAELMLGTSEDDDFVIETKLGQKITQSELFIKSEVKINKHGKSVDRNPAWRELKGFYDHLSTSGALEG
jgi:hypothetical protein